MPPAWRWQPSPADGDELDIVATAAIRGVEAWRLDGAGAGPHSVDEAWQMVVDTMLSPLAAFHRVTRDLAIPGAAVPACLLAAEPWGLRLMDGDAAPELWETEVTARLLREAAADADLVAGLRAGRALWRPLALIHADLKHDNILCDTDSDGVTARVLDWEMAQIGDPAWDLATLASRLLVARGDGPPWTPADIEAIASLASRYARCTGLAVAGLAARLVHYSGARLLMMALQQESAAPDADASSRQLVMRARATFARAPGLAAAIGARAAAAA